MIARFPAALLALALAAGAAAAQGAQGGDPEMVHVRMHRRIAPSVVYVAGGNERGTGFCIAKDGIILTSPTACGATTEEAVVVVPGGRQVPAQVIGRDNDKEIALLKIDVPLPALEFADSAQVRPGQVSYVFGDCFDSIVNDDQVSMSFGAVSATYELQKRQRGTYYTGPVIETSAAVNPNEDGAPLVNAEGRVIGMVTMNYEESKFTGLAIPANELKGRVDTLVKLYRNPSLAVAAPAANPGWLGATIEELDDAEGLRVKRLAYESPAGKAGLKVGDVIRRVNSRRVLTDEGFAEAMSKFEPGAQVRLTIDRDGKEQVITVVLGKKHEY